MLRYSEVKGFFFSTRTRVTKESGLKGINMQYGAKIVLDLALRLETVPSSLPLGVQGAWACRGTGLERVRGKMGAQRR